MKINAIVTGATGMVGEGVLHECLLSNHVAEVLVVGRKSCGIVHPKLKEIILKDFFDLTSIQDQLHGYNACFFCLGVSSVGFKEAAYYKFTYTLTMNFARIAAANNTDMDFCYVSGTGTDSTEKGRSMWARVKGKTENDLIKLPFKKVYNFRPGFMLPTAGLKRTLKYYKYFNWSYPFFRKVLPKYFSTLKELGLAMIQAVISGHEKNAVEVKDIVKLAGEIEK